MLRRPRSSTVHAIALPSDDAVRLSAKGAERIASIVNCRASAAEAGLTAAAAKITPSAMASLRIDASPSYLRYDEYDCDKADHRIFRLRQDRHSDRPRHGGRGFP